ncbi:hypothetical protein V1520DRAFT_350077 [Lipomyces starkeyi]|uniref:Uncharacterized protein n=1 Tax=Lipomyces starkeyi NRRL Y-11557 TaxID=675824 RepID=A0A1E3Q1A0_LIPST|nr:hypothetical protein LIPSTDRAFT_323549 [Lipomyces starkeyi NRRL Y-11557]
MQLSLVVVIRKSRVVDINQRDIRKLKWTPNIISTKSSQVSMSSGANYNMGRFFANPRSVLMLLMFLGPMQSVNAHNGVLCATLILPIAYNQEGRAVFTGYNPINAAYQDDNWNCDMAMSKHTASNGLWREKGTLFWVWFDTGKPECSYNMVNYGGDGEITPPLIVDCVHYGPSGPVTRSWNLSESVEQSPLACSGPQFGSLSYVMYDGGTYCGTYVDYS